MSSRFSCGQASALLTKGRAANDWTAARGRRGRQASKQFSVDRRLAVAKSVGSKYVEFGTPASQVKLALYGRRTAARDAVVAPDRSGSHRIVIGSDVGPFADPAGLVWVAV